jgi:hypothetical protein
LRLVFKSYFSSGPKHQRYVGNTFGGDCHLLRKEGMKKPHRRFSGLVGMKPGASDSEI